MIPGLMCPLSVAMVPQEPTWRGRRGLRCPCMWQRDPAAAQFHYTSSVRSQARRASKAITIFRVQFFFTVQRGPQRHQNRE